MRAQGPGVDRVASGFCAADHMGVHAQGNGRVRVAQAGRDDLYRHT